MNRELLFCSDYPKARASFLQFCQEKSGVIEHFLNPLCKGPQGEELYTDVVRFGSSSAKKVLFNISGTHGLECPAGRTAFLHWLEQTNLKSLPEDISIYFVHAINPYGFAHLSRTTENNVDLNRNFVDFSQTKIENSVYDDLHPIICPDNLDQLTKDSINSKLKAVAEQLTWPVVTDGLMKGQYSQPEGIMYGGDHREWSAELLERIVAKELAKAQQVLYIDWHTGLGEYGEDFYICLHDPNTPRFKSLNKILAGKLDHTSAGFMGGKIPHYEGLLLARLDETLAHCQRMGFVVEMGTKDNASVSNALMLDAWERSHKNIEPEQRRAIKKQLLQLFYPDDPEWQNCLLEKSFSLLDKAYRHLQHGEIPTY